MRTGVLRTALVMAAVVVTSSGCASADWTAPPPVRPTSEGTIGVAMPADHSRWAVDGTSMQKQFAMLGYRTDLQYAAEDPQRQAAQISAMIDHHDKALVVGSIDGTALKQVLQRAADAKIPVISYDRLIRDTPNVSAYATFDNFKVGVLQAETIVGALGLDQGTGPFTIELFGGAPTDNNAGYFLRGSMSVLQPYLSTGKLVVRSGLTTLDEVGTRNWDPKPAQARMVTLLSRFYSSTRLDAVLSGTDDISGALADALVAAGYGGAGKPMPVLTGQDSGLEAVKRIIAGRQTETIYKDTRELAKVAVQMTNSLLTGETLETTDSEQYNNGVKAVPTFLLQPVNVDKSNYQRVLVGGGYYTAAQLGA